MKATKTHYYYFQVVQYPPFLAKRFFLETFPIPLFQFQSPLSYPQFEEGVLELGNARFYSTPALSHRSTVRDAHDDMAHAHNDTDDDEYIVKSVEYKYKNNKNNKK